MISPGSLNFTPLSFAPDFSSINFYFSEGRLSPFSFLFSAAPSFPRIPFLFFCFPPQVDNGFPPQQLGEISPTLSPFLSRFFLGCPPFALSASAPLYLHAVYVRSPCRSFNFRLGRLNSFFLCVICFPSTRFLWASLLPPPATLPVHPQPASMVFSPFDHSLFGFPPATRMSLSWRPQSRPAFLCPFPPPFPLKTFPFFLYHWYSTKIPHLCRSFRLVPPIDVGQKNALSGALPVTLGEALCCFFFLSLLPPFLQSNFSLTFRRCHLYEYLEWRRFPPVPLRPIFLSFSGGLNTRAPN